MAHRQPLWRLSGCREDDFMSVRQACCRSCVGPAANVSAAPARPVRLLAALGEPPCRPVLTPPSPDVQVGSPDRDERSGPAPRHSRRAQGTAGNKIPGSGRTRSLPEPTRPLPPNRRRCGGEHGFVTAQFVLVIPIVLFAFVAAVQGGAYLHAQRVVQAAAEDGSEAARASNGTADTGRAVALDTLSQLAGSSVTGVAVRASRDRDEAVVEVVGRAAGPLGAMTVRASSSGPVERFRPVPAGFSR